MSKEMLDAFNKAFTEFKEKNDERLKALEAGQDVSAELKQHLARLDKELDECENKIESKAGTLEQHIAQMQELVDRSAFAPKENASKFKDEAAYFYKMALANSKGTIANIELDKNGQLKSVSDEAVKAYQAYKPVFIEAAKRNFRNLPSDILNVLTVGSQPGGGYLVPADMTGRIVEYVYETSPLRGYATVQQIGADRLQGVYDLDELAATWEGEQGSTSTTNTPNLGEYEVYARELYAKPAISLKALEDSSLDLSAWLVGKLGNKFSRAENEAFVTGTGVKSPRGFTTYAAGTPTATAFNVIEQTLSGVTYSASNNGLSNPDALIALEETLKAPYQANAIYVMSRATRRVIRQLKDGKGGYYYQNGQGGTPATLNEKPLVIMEDMADPGTNSLSIAYGDFGEGYTIVDRLGITILEDPYTSSNQVKYRARKRTGGDVTNFEAIKLMKFAAS